MKLAAVVDEVVDMMAMMVKFVDACFSSFGIQDCETKINLVSFSFFP